MADCRIVNEAMKATVEKIMQPTLKPTNQTDKK